jgi:hypothetical protein
VIKKSDDGLEGVVWRTGGPSSVCVIHQLQCLAGAHTSCGILNLDVW